MNVACRPLVLVAVLASSLSAEVVKLKDKSEIRGVVVEKSTTQLVVLTRTGNISVPMTDVAEIAKLRLSTSRATNVLPPWDHCLGAMLRTTWGKETKEIPATVIDTGVMQRVPYISYRAGDYEMNLYGDPERPVGIEIGFYGESDSAAKGNCFALMREMLNNASQGMFLATLDWQQDTKQSDGLTFEVTPATAPDAYGAWWVSVYDEKGLDAARASVAEVAAISIARDEVAKNPEPATAPVAVVGPQTPTPAPVVATAPRTDWTPSDLRYARSAPAVSSGTGRVYVKGYTRKDGTYVQPHTRSRPRR